MLRRHQLAWLGDVGWAQVLAQPRDPLAAACVAHWAASHLPLVVTQQGPVATVLSLGLPAPVRWQRRRIAVSVRRDGVSFLGAFPAAREVAPLVPRRSRAAWLDVCDMLARLGVPARVHGSHGWEHLTGEIYLRPGSDLDLHVSVETPAVADAVADCLAAADPKLPRLDGELVFPDGGAIAWREWSAFRAGDVDEVLVKRLRGVSMEVPA